MKRELASREDTLE